MEPVVSSPAPSGFAARMSKAKFAALKDMMAVALKDDAAVQAALKCVRDVLNFDPDASSYSQLKGQHIQAYRMRKRERAAQAADTV